MNRVRVEKVNSLEDKVLIEKILKIEEEAFGPSGVDIYSLPAFILFGAVYVLFLDNTLAGVCELIRGWESDEALIYGFSIKKEFRNKGLGKIFLQEILKNIPRDIKVLYLTVAEENIPALKIYRNSGFEIVSKEENLFGQGEHRLIMKKEL